MVALWKASENGFPTALVPQILHLTSPKSEGPVARPLLTLLRLRHLGARRWLGRLAAAPPRSWSSTPPPAGWGWAARELGTGPPPLSRIERGLRSKPARIDRNRLVAKNSPARIAVARVSTLAVPRLDRKPPAAAHAEPAAFGLLQQDQAHHGEHDHQVDQDDDSLHERSAQTPVGADGPGPRSLI